MRVGEFDKFRGDGNIADDVVADLKSRPLDGGDFLWSRQIVWTMASTSVVDDESCVMSLTEVSRITGT